jgi:dihydropteroate synthase
VGDRLEGSLASAVWAMNAGVGMVRVHDVTATLQASRLVEGS